MTKKNDAPGAANMEVYRAVRDRLTDLRELPSDFWGEVVVSVSLQNGRVTLVKLEEKSVKKYPQSGHTDEKT